jgi:hypothetical protein
MDSDDPPGYLFVRFAGPADGPKRVTQDIVTVGRHRGAVLGHAEPVGGSTDPRHTFHGHLWIAEFLAGETVDLQIKQPWRDPGSAGWGVVRWERVDPRDAPRLNVNRDRLSGGIMSADESHEADFQRRTGAPSSCTATADPPVPSQWNGFSALPTHVAEYWLVHGVGLALGRAAE